MKASVLSFPKNHLLLQILRIIATSLLLATTPKAYADTQNNFTDYEKIISQHRLTGMSVAIVDNYEIIHTETVGLREFGTNKKIDIETAFSAASISKAVTGIVIAMLAEEGIVNLDAPVSTYLKRWQLPLSNYTKDTPVTLRHLLSHTAGTSQSGFADYLPGDDVPTLLESLKGQKLQRTEDPIAIKWKPGTRFKYSGGGFIIAQVAIEDATGKSLAALAQEKLFQPLGMANTTMYQLGHPKFLKNVAKAHSYDQTLVGLGGIPIYPQTAASGMWTNATDMAKLVIDIQKALAGKKSIVISRRVAETTTRLQTLHKAGGWSLGWARNQAEGNLDWFSHLGYNTGIGGAVMATMTGGKAIIVFGNGVHRVRVPAINAVINDTIKVLGWAKPIIPSHNTPSYEVVNKIVGNYENLNQGYWSPFNEVISIKEIDGKLLLQNSIGRSASKKLIYIGGGNFKIDQLTNSEVSFQINPEDNEAHLAFTREDSDLVSYPLKKLSDNKQLPFDVAIKSNFTEALAAYQNWQKRRPNSNLLSARNLIAAGKHASKQGNVNGARNFYKLCLTFHPNNSAAKELLGSLK